MRVRPIHSMYGVCSALLVHGAEDVVGIDEQNAPQALLDR